MDALLDDLVLLHHLDEDLLVDIGLELVDREGAQVRVGLVLELLVEAGGLQEEGERRRVGSFEL